MSRYQPRELFFFLHNMLTYNPPINFRAISLATLRHVLDSYHAITPVRFDICPPPLIFTEKSKVCGKKARTSVSIVILLYMEEKRPFLYSLAIVTLENLSECCFRNYKEDNKIRTRKLALENAKYFGALQKFSLHHNLPSLDLITVDI